jgi:hypothetical protein
MWNATHNTFDVHSTFDLFLTFDFCSSSGWLFFTLLLRSDVPVDDKKDFAKLFEFEDIVINVAATVHGNAAIDRLGAPNLGRNFDHKSTGGRRDGCSSRDGGRIDKLAARMERRAGISKN